MIRIIKNEDVREVRVEIPEGHQHIRTTVVLRSGEELVFQEATVSNILRAFITVKTHPVKKSVVLRAKKLKEKKEGYAEWQLLEDE
ncbi:MAG: hypothetical protein D6710_06970 [Nitrospirae bacterium]|nr:MAG: hypothetical protein D6710_06970 [Nitrospirota bacterium]